jgi:pimeloyl-ACP methyl ester carboxylesterase
MIEGMSIRTIVDCCQAGEALYESENDAMGKYDLEIARAQRSLRRRETVIDGPFAETKELVLGDWPVSPGAFGRRAGRDGYADVNGLRMYYEVHGSGRPLVLLHGGLSTIDQEFGSVVRSLSYGRQVIAVEQQAHGRTADIDRALSFEQMADDTANLLLHLDIEQADFFGFSMGGATALQIAIRYPQLARKLAIVSSGYSLDGFQPGMLDMLLEYDAADPLPDPARQREFERVAATPEQWPAAVSRLKEAIGSYEGLRRQYLRSIQAQTLFVAGETGLVRPEHVGEMSRLVPESKLKVFPGNDHDPTIISRSAALLPGFLDAPLQRTA